MRQDNKKVSMLNRNAEQTRGEDKWIDEETRIRRVANKVIRQLGFCTINVYDVKRESSGLWHLHFNGTLTTKERREIIPSIAEELNIPNEELEFIGFLF